ncbi:MAG TPA: PF13754 domain-containing protein [Pseudoneobacillus sp.]|nr:PF13754 domain-containing protein [Pseudoneobacillus sp.]
MAIVRMTGTVDGNPIIFSKDGGGFWTASIPKDVDGEWVVDITAFDEAGNTSYSAMLLTVRSWLDTLDVKIVPLNYSVVEVSENYPNKNETPDFVFMVVDNTFKYGELQQNYYFTEVI